MVVRCDSQDEATARRSAEARRVEERRRAALDPVELDRIVIEADPLRRTIESSLSVAFRKPSWGTSTVSTGEGSQCTCMNICPPPPLPCCACSAPPARYGSSPGSSPLN